MANEQLDDVVGDLEDDSISLDGSITDMIASVDDAKKIPMDNTILSRLRAMVIINLLVNNLFTYNISHVHLVHLLELWKLTRDCSRLKMQKTSGLSKDRYNKTKKSHFIISVPIIRNKIV